MKDAALKGHNQLKKSVLGIISEDQGEYGIVKGINHLVIDFEKTGVLADFSVFENEENNMQLYNNTIYRICQEALTNSLRHGKATNVSIILKLSDDMISLYIIDDGVGCKNIKKSIGLSNM